jgi:transposase
MSNSPDIIPSEPAELRAFTVGLLAELKNRDLLIEKLRHQMAGQNTHRFGSKAEGIDQLQLRLEDDEVAEAAAIPLKQPKQTDEDTKAKPKRKPLPDHLPRVEQVLSIGDACTDCGGALRELGRDTTDELEYVPGRFVVNQIIRPRMACKCCEAISQAPMPSRPIEKGIPGPGFLAHVLISKYMDHLPLYRQAQIFAREGLNMDRSTLAGWVGKVAALLQPLAEAIKRYVLSGQAIFADNTPVKLLAAGNGKTKTARFWAYGPSSASPRFMLSRKKRVGRHQNGAPRSPSQLRQGLFSIGSSQTEDGNDPKKCDPADCNVERLPICSDHSNKGPYYGQAIFWRTVKLVLDCNRQYQSAAKGA